MNKGTVFSNFLWRFAERCGAQLVSLVVSIVLARLLSPNDYGTVALMMVFINILSVFIDGGFSISLIQKKESDDVDFSTIFTFNIISCLLIYGIIFFTSPLISKFYGNHELTLMMRVLGLTILISGVKSIQIAYVSKNMLFKRFFFATLAGTIGAGIVGILMAYMGCGAWAIIAQSLFNNLVDAIVLWITVKWRPKKIFSFKRLKGLFSFSWKLLVASLLDTAYNNLNSLIIGKRYTSEDLAFYNKGNSWPNLIVTNVNNSIDSVLLPAMSQEQNDLSRVKSMVRRSIKTSTYVMAPLMIGMIACGTPLIRLIITEKWLPAVLFQSIFCITYMFYPIHTANLNAIKSLGRSDIFLRLEVYKKVVGLIALIIASNISVVAMGYSLLVTSVLCQIINASPNKKLLNYGYIEQLKDIFPGIFLALIMGLIIYPITLLSLPDIITISVMILIGACVYIGGSKLFHLDSYQYLTEIVKSHFYRKKK